MSITTQTINRIKRVTALIDENAKLATPGPWGISHSHVYGVSEDGTHFDIASQPYERSRCVYGVHPDSSANWGHKDMRHIATCNPITMQKLVEDVRALLAERDSIVALAERLDDLINNTIGADQDERTRALGEAANNYLETAP